MNEIILSFAALSLSLCAGGWIKWICSTVDIWLRCGKMWDCEAGIGEFGSSKKSCEPDIFSCSEIEVFLSLSYTNFSTVPCYPAFIYALLERTTRWLWMLRGRNLMRYHKSLIGCMSNYMYRFYCQFCQGRVRSESTCGLIDWLFSYED